MNNILTNKYWNYNLLPLEKKISRLLPIFRRKKFQTFFINFFSKTFFSIFLQKVFWLLFSENFYRRNFFEILLWNPFRTKSFDFFRTFFQTIFFSKKFGKENLLTSFSKICFWKYFRKFFKRKCLNFCFRKCFSKNFFRRFFSKVFLI